MNVNRRSSPVYFRVDAGGKNGYGHLSRCLALAEACRKYSRKAIFLLGGGVAEAASRVKAAGFRVETIAHSHPQRYDLRRMRQLAGRAAWLVLDGYHFDLKYRRALRAAGLRLILIDDLGDMGPYEADILVNPNPGAESIAYSDASGALVLQGPRYALLSETFRRRRRLFPRLARKVLVTMGASDPDNLSAKLLRALERSGIEDLRVELLVGAANPWARELAELAYGCGFRVELTRDAADVPARMARAELCVSAGGVTAREALRVGLPTISGWCAENQHPSTLALAEAEAILSMGDWRRASVGRIATTLKRLASDSKARRALSGAGQKLIDGQGASRVIGALNLLSRPGASSERLALREAGAEHLIPLWRLANEPSVRAHSFNKKSIPLKSHRRWFDKLRGSRDQALFVVEAGGVLAGVARYSRFDRGEGEVHFSVHPAFRGKGVATAALRASWSKAMNKLGLRSVIGRVILPNPASERVFLKAGYRRLPSAQRGVALFKRTRNQ